MDRIPNDFLKKRNNWLIARLNNESNLSRFSNGYWNNGVNQLTYINASNNVNTFNNPNSSFENVRLNPQFYSSPYFIANATYEQSNLPPIICGNSMFLNSDGSRSVGNLPLNPFATSYVVETTPNSYPIMNDDNTTSSLPLPSSAFINENNGLSLSEVENRGIPSPIEVSLTTSDNKAKKLESNSLIFHLFNEDQSKFSFNNTENDRKDQNFSSSSTANMKEMVFSTKDFMKNEMECLNLVEMTNDAHKKNSNNTEGTTKIYVNAIILIKLWNMGKISRFIDKKTHTIYYCTRKVNSNGEINVSIDYDCILKNIPGIKYMNVITIQDKTRKVIKDLEYNLEEKGNESNKLIVPMKTNSESRKTIELSFSDEEKNEKFRTSLKLRDSKTKRRKFEKELKDKKKLKGKSKESEKGENIQNCIKIEIINGFIRKFRKVPEKFLDDSIRFGLDVMYKTLETVINDWKIKKIFEKKEKEEEEIKNLENAVKYRNPENETFEKFRDIIFNHVKDEEKKKELLILCFDSLYKFIYNIDENVVDICKVNYFNHPIYKNFLKKYFIGHCRQNRIVITMDDLEPEIHCKEKECKRRYDSIGENEDLEDGKKQKTVDEEQCYPQTDK